MSGPIVVHSVDELGPEWDALFAAGPGVQSSREWLSASIEAALPPEAEPHLVGFADSHGPIALFPMLDTHDGTFRSLTTPYTCLYQPLLRPGAEPQPAMCGFARYCRRWPVTRLEALDPDWPGFGPLLAGFGPGRLAVRRFTHFVNWYATIPSRRWDLYLQSRPGALRETIRRKMRAAERNARLRFELAYAGPALMHSLEAYEHVYARSWKPAEPFPEFNQALLRHLSVSGAVRMFILRQDDLPIAAQYWTVTGGVATVLKLAHDDAFKALSPGTVLTAYAIRHLIDIDGVSNLDFGRGDDPYKRGWTGDWRTRVGVLGLDPTAVRGVRTLIQHDLGRLWRHFRKQPAASTSR